MEDAKIILSSEELEKLKIIQTELNNVMLNLGSIEIQFKDLQDLKTQMLSTLSTLRQNQEQLGTELNKKYGNGTIDMDTGEFTINK
jgi:conjugal transfer/entry exclusion protein